MKKSTFDDSNLHNETKRCKAGGPIYLFLGFKSNPGFREKLAEREEAMALGRVLFHKDFFKDVNICTITIRQEMQP